MFTVGCDASWRLADSYYAYILWGTIFQSWETYIQSFKFIRSTYHIGYFDYWLYPIWCYAQFVNHCESHPSLLDHSRADTYPVVRLFLTPEVTDVFTNPIFTTAARKTMSASLHCSVRIHHYENDILSAVVPWHDGSLSLRRSVLYCVGCRGRTQVHKTWSCTSINNGLCP